MNAPYEHDPRIAELDEELELLDRERVEAVKPIKERARLVRAERDRLLMIEQLTLCVLNGQPLSPGETAWTEAHPDEWAAIQAATLGKAGSRAVQRVPVT